MFHFAVSTISTVDGRRRMDTIHLTSECYGQRLLLRRALCAKHPGNESLFDLVEAGPAVEVPIETFTSLALDEKAKVANGIDVDLEVLLSLKTAQSSIIKLIRDTGSNPEIFIGLI
jgi:hypothetical protein